jgi:hypothetical protein
MLVRAFQTSGDRSRRSGSVHQGLQDQSCEAPEASQLPELDQNLRIAISEFRRRVEPLPALAAAYSADHGAWKSILQALEADSGAQVGELGVASTRAARRLDIASGLIDKVLNTLEAI